MEISIFTCVLFVMHFAQVIFKIEKLYIKIELLDKKKKGEEGKKKRRKKKKERKNDAFAIVV